MQITGTVALVAGGAGLLGSATAARLLDNGAAVLIADRAPSARSEALLAEHPDHARFLATDITDDSSVGAAVAAAAALGDLRIAVNCAGAGIIQRTLAQDGQVHSLADFRGMVELNLVGAFIFLSRCAEAMARTPATEPDKERGVVINTSSLAGLEGSAGQVAYGAAKAGVAGMTLPAARDLSPVGIRVLTIAPGGMAEPGSVDDTDARVAALMSNVVHPRRFGLPQEYALLVTQLVENPYLNGTLVRLDGGAHLGFKY
jgi:NAD(P)-dependent dehydrogenase (short-subunit alcohol dehydrogenase family)